MAQQTLNTPRETTHQRIAAALEAIEQNMSDEHEAVNIDYDNTYSGLSADNVQEAIDELNSEKANTADLGTAASKDVPTSGNATSTQVVMGNDSRLTNARPASDVSAWAKASTKPTYTASEVGAYTKTESDNKYVAKETGKGLSTEDYTTEEKTKLAGIEAEANKTVVDSSMSTTSTNPLQNKVITAELQGSKTATGNPITVTDAAPVNAVNLSMDLEPIQDLHGYDHPWVGGAGKNKLPPFTSTTLNNVAVAVDSQGIITLNNTSSASGNINVSVPLKAGTYKISGAYGNSDFYKTSTMGDNNRLYINVNGTNYFDNVDGGREFTVTQDTTCTVYMVIVSGYTFNNSVINPMIRLSTETDPTFERYSNICPISGRSELTITDKDNPTNPTVTKTYTIQFGQTVYGAHVDATKGGLVVDTAEVDLGSLSWVKSSTGNKFFATLSSAYPNSAYNVMISSCYEFDGYGNSERGYYPENGKFRYAFPATAYEIYITDERYSDATAFKEAITGQTLVYELATPQTIQLTPQQIKLLENTNTLYTDYEGDTIHIEYQPNNAIGEAVRVVEESYDAIIQNLIDRITALENS